MKKSVILLLCLMGIALPVAAQKNNYCIEDRNVGTFYSVKASMGIDVVITQGNKHGVRVESENETIMERTETYVEGGTLYVKYSVKVNDNSLKGRNTVYVTAPEIKEVRANMGADVRIDGTLKGSYIKIVANMGSDIKGSINCKTADVSAKMGSDVSLEGKADICIASATGGSDVSLKKLKCDEVTATASGGSDIDLYASKSLDAKASGGSDIRYWGNPNVRNVRGSASSNVRPGK